MIEKLRVALGKHQVLRINDLKPRASAVLIPIFLKDGQYHILFIQRTDRVREHKGQVSFPGGACEKTDKLLIDTALREAEEEIGLNRNDVKVLGQLDDMLTASTNYVIAPFVGLIPWPYEFKLDKWETEELIEAPIKALMDEKCCSEGTTSLDGKEIATFSFKCGDKVIWGATARILKQFLEIIAEIETSY